MADYTKSELFTEFSKVDNFRFFYQHKIINYRGPKSSTKEKYTEIAAEWVIDHIENFQQIPPIQRNKTYYSKSHNGKSKNPDAVSEKQTAIKMYNQGIISGAGEILDYQTPLKNKQIDKVGEIDVLAFDKDKKILRILELKIPNSSETMLRCVLEAYTYLKTVDGRKLIRDFNRDGNTNIPEDTPIVACPFVFRYMSDGKDGLQYIEMQQDRPKLKKLMELLEIKPLYIEGIEGQYTASEL